MNRSFPLTIGLLLSSLLLSTALQGQSAVTASPHWISTWATSQEMAPTVQARPNVPQGTKMPDFSKMKRPTNRIAVPAKLEDQTIRMIAHTSIGGHKGRVELSNAFGSPSVSISSVHIALRTSGSLIDKATDRPLTFGGSSSVELRPGMVLVSDPIDLTLPAFSDVAVSLHVLNSGGKPANHMLALHTGYISQGDQTGAEEMLQPEITTSYLWLRAIDVEAPPTDFAIVCLGDSITDGFATSLDKNQAWPALLAERLAKRFPHRSIAVTNGGISGNQVLADGAGVSAVARFDRDVLSTNGVRWVILLEGINDINIHGQISGPDALTAEDLIAGYQQLIARAHTHGLRIMGATLTPEEGVWLAGPIGEATRQTVNTWIRTSHAFDAVVDFDAAVRDTAHLSRISSEYNSGDNIHPNDAGNRKMADTFDLNVFTK